MLNVLDEARNMPFPHACSSWIWAAVGFMWGSLLVYSAIGSVALAYQEAPHPRATGAAPAVPAAPAVLCEVEAPWG